jgi:branched-chain amino acid transport system substrate-binding protein
MTGSKRHRVFDTACPALWERLSSISKLLSDPYVLFAARQEGRWKAQAEIDHALAIGLQMPLHDRESFLFIQGIEMAGVVGQGLYRAAIVASALALTQFCISANAQECEAKIGVVGPMSGGAALWGLSARNGAEIAAAEYNQAGGLPMDGMKCKIVVLSYDSKYSAEGAAAAANNLASQDVSVIIGPVGSPEATGIKPVAERNKQVTTNATYAKDAIGTQWPLAFHAVPGPGAWAKALVKMAKEQYDIKSIVVVAPNDQGGTDVGSMAVDAYRGVGIDTTEEYYQRGTTNFAPIVARIMRSDPTAIDLCSSPPGDAATLVKQLLEAGFKGVFGRMGGTATEEIIKAAGGVESLGNFYWLESVYISQANLDALVARQKSIGQSNPGNPVVVAIFAASGRLALKAISKARTSSDGVKVAEELRKLPIDDPWLGNGDWTGMPAFGIRQEFGFPVGMGMIVKGKKFGVTPVSVVGQ